MMQSYIRLEVGTKFSFQGRKKVYVVDEIIKISSKNGWNKYKYIYSDQNGNIYEKIFHNDYLNFR